MNFRLDLFLSETGDKIINHKYVLLTLLRKRDQAKFLIPGLTRPHEQKFHERSAANFTADSGSRKSSTKNTRIEIFSRAADYSFQSLKR